MAKTNYKENHLEDEYEKYNNGRILFGALTIIVFILFLTTEGNTWLPLPFVVFGFLCNKCDSIAKVKKSGLKGEEKALRIYEGLSDEYYVLSDLNVEVDEKVSQIDNIVIGNNGIFVIETKNLNGVIEGNELDKRIVQHKVGRKGGKYSKEIYNPIKQVGTHVYRVSEALKKNNINVWVQGVVYFSNNDCKVCLKSEKTPIFAASENGDKEMINYIQNYANRRSNITSETKEEIFKVLSEFSIMQDNINISNNIDINNNQMTDEQNRIFQQQMIDQQNRLFQEETMELSRKSVTSFDEGGFVQGEGFNLSDTMNADLFNQMDDLMNNF